MKDIEFYHGCPSGSYEKALIDNYERLKRNTRTQDIAKLKKEINK